MSPAPRRPADRDIVRDAILRADRFTPEQRLILLEIVAAFEAVNRRKAAEEGR